MNREIVNTQVGQASYGARNGPWNIMQFQVKKDRPRPRRSDSVDNLTALSTKQFEPNFIDSEGI